MSLKNKVSLNVGNKREYILLKKFAIFSSSVIVAIIAIQIIAVPVVVILNTSSVSNSPKILGALIFVLGFCIAISWGVFVFKKMFRYLKKEFQNI